ncbi:hypothetical protein Tco_1116293, partial [Tanacetum coccineum]
NAHVSKSQQTPAEVITVEGKTRILQFHFNSSTINGAIQFTLDDVLDKKMKGAEAVTHMKL